MGDNSNSNVKIDITADASGTEPGFSQTEAKLDHLGRSSGKLANEYSGLDAATKKMTGSMSNAAVDTKKLDAELTSLLTRINPAYAAVKNLDQGTDLLHRGLASGLITTRQYNASIGLLEGAFAKANRATAGSVIMTARAKQEMVVLGRELASGNFSRMPGTLSIIAQGLSPVAWGIAGVTAALVAGGYAWWKWGEDARIAAKKAMEGADAAEEAADRAQRPNQLERLAKLYKDIGKLETDRADLMEKSKRVGLSGAGGKGELWNYEKDIAEKQREIWGLKRQALDLQAEIEKGQEKANKPPKPPKYKREFDPEGDFWDSVDEAGRKNRKKAREDGDTDAERSATETARKIADAEEKEAKRAGQAWERFTENVQRNLGDVLYNGLNGKFQDIGDIFKQMLLRMAADAAAANLTQAMFGNGGFSLSPLSTLLGMNGGLVDPVTGVSEAGTGVEFVGEGGGFTGYGARAGGLDGRGGFRAILHPNETVIDHTKGQGGGGNVIYLTYAPVNNIDARSDIAQVQQIAEASSRRGSAELVDKLQRAGAL